LLNGSADRPASNGTSRAWDLPGMPITEEVVNTSNGPNLNDAEIVNIEGPPSPISQFRPPAPKGPSPPLQGDITARLDQLTNAVFGMRKELLESIGDLNERTGRIESQLKVLQAKDAL